MGAVTRNRGCFFMQERRFYEQRTVWSHARCDGRKAACPSIADFQSGGIQPFEQPGLPDLADRRAQIGNEKWACEMAEKPHKQESVKTRSRPGKSKKQLIATAQTHHSMSELFLYENRCYSQFKSRRKSPKNASIVTWNAERNANENRTYQAAENHKNIF